MRDPINGAHDHHAPNRGRTILLFIIFSFALLSASPNAFVEASDKKGESDMSASEMSRVSLADRMHLNLPDKETITALFTPLFFRITTDVVSILLLALVS